MTHASFSCDSGESARLDPHLLQSNSSCAGSSGPGPKVVSMDQVPLEPVETGVREGRAWFRGCGAGGSTGGGSRTSGYRTG